MSETRRFPVTRWSGGEASGHEDAVAAEVPVALSYNRRPYVVMMATPTALDDFALGFSLTEGVIDRPADLLDAALLERDKGLELAITIGPDSLARLDAQRRNLAGRTGCGLCGAESLDQALRDPPAVSSRVRVSDQALQTAVCALGGRQPLQALTGALHGAAWCDLDGAILQVREDVGRHNALDKLIGCLARSGFDPCSGFVVVSSRASYEMVHKAAVAGMEVLVAVSAPTTLAIEFAQRSGLTLVGFARPGRHNVYTFAARIEGP